MHNNSKRNWTTIDTRTITLQIFLNWDDFVEISGIENNEDYQKIFQYLYSLYGNLYTKPNTKELLANRLRFYIENEQEKVNKQNEVWDNQIEKLFGEYSQLQQYDIGELKPEDSEDKDFNKYLFARQSELKQKDILNKIDQLQKMKTPFENTIEVIKNKIFIPYQKDKDQIKNIIGEEND